MTLTLRDLSDYDADPITFAGLVGVTHKATEGSIPDSLAEGNKIAARLDGARAAGLSVLGSYHVLRTPGSGEPGGTVAGTLPQQLARWVTRLDSVVPYWRTWPHWIMQVDAEKWSYDSDMPANVLAFADLLAHSGLPGYKVTYASRGQYGDSLTGIATDLWNADYPGGAYPGDTWAPGWAPYSGKTPVLLQWNGGPDLNAYRGTLDQLLALTAGGTMELTDPLFIPNWDNDPRVPSPTEGSSVGEALMVAQQRSYLALRTAQSVEKKVDALTTAVAALALPAPAPVDPAALKAVLLDPAVLAAIANAVASTEGRKLQS